MQQVFEGVGIGAVIFGMLGMVAAHTHETFVRSVWLVGVGLATTLVAHAMRVS